MGSTGSSVDRMIANKEYAKLGDYISRHKSQYGLSENDDAYVYAYNMIEESNSTRVTEQDIMALATNDYQNRQGAYPRSNVPDSIYVDKLNNNTFNISADFKNTSVPTANRWLTRFAQEHGLNIAVESMAHQSGDYHNDWVTAELIVRLR